jgi:hypothetical protein
LKNKGGGDGGFLPDLTITAPSEKACQGRAAGKTILIQTGRFVLTLKNFRVSFFM